MQIYEFGENHADILLIQPVDDHDLSGMEREAAAIRAIAGERFRLIAVRVDRWNLDLSPWTAPAVFGNEDFGDGAKNTLEQILPLADGYQKRTVIGGYSLAGLFALWAGYQTEAFSGIAAASPSIWFPGFTDYMAQKRIRTGCVYLSLGDREERTRNTVMSKVGAGIRQAHNLLEQQGIPAVLEWNPGNHFREPDLRTAKAFGWVVNHLSPFHSSGSGNNEKPFLADDPG